MAAIVCQASTPRSPDSGISVAMHDAKHHDLVFDNLEVQPIRKAVNEGSSHLAVNARKQPRLTADAGDDLVDC